MTTTATATKPQQLPLEFRKRGFDYKLLKRGEKALMYQASNKSVISHYEVFQIRIAPAGEYMGKWYDNREQFPGNECFGRWAWCISGSHLERAEQRFRMIEESKYFALVDPKGKVICADYGLKEEVEKNFLFSLLLIEHDGKINIARKKAATLTLQEAIDKLKLQMKEGDKPFTKDESDGDEDED